MSEKKKSVFVTVRVSPATKEAVDAYRRAQETIPSRSDAIEKLIGLGFSAWKQPEMGEKEKRNEH